MGLESSNSPGMKEATPRLYQILYWRNKKSDSEVTTFSWRNRSSVGIHSCNTTALQAPRSSLLSLDRPWRASAHTMSPALTSPLFFKLLRASLTANFSVCSVPKTACCPWQRASVLHISPPASNSQLIKFHSNQKQKLKPKEIHFVMCY